MGSRINSGINWSLNELKKLVNDKKSCVHFEKARRHIALHPFHMTDLNKALHEILSSSINFHDLELKGLLLSYKNPKLLSSLGSILYDSHYIHVDIEADFYVFRPEIGSTLNGVVNKKAINHIGVLVHKAFNVSIPIPDGDDNEDDRPENYLEVGQDVEFIVTHVDFKGKLPFIRGKLLSESSVTDDENNGLPLSPTKQNQEHSNDDNKMDYCINNTNESKKTTKSSKRPNFLSSILNESSDSDSGNDTESIQKLSRKKSENKKVTKEKSPQKHDKIIFEESKDKEKVKKKKAKSISTIKLEDKLALTSPNGKIFSNEDCSDENVSIKKGKKKSEKIKVEKNQSEYENLESNVKELNKKCKDESSDETSSVSVTAVDKKPRIIHDRVLNTNERNITVDRKPLNTSIKRRIFAHDISDSDDETDSYMKPLTQSFKSSADEKKHEKVKVNTKTISNGFKSNDRVETNDESDEDLHSNKKIIVSNKSLKKKVNSPQSKIENKDHIENNITTASELKSNHVDRKCRVTGIETESTDISDIDNGEESKKKLKKKLKSLTPEKLSDHSIEFPSPSQFTKVEKESVLNSSGKSRNTNRSESENDNESTNSISPKKSKIKKHNGMFVGNMRIKSEPDSSDIDSSPKKKSEKKQKNNITDDCDSLEQIQVKSESITIKKEKNKTKEMKRKHRESTNVKCESGDSDLDSVPRKKIKTIFSE